MHLDRRQADGSDRIPQGNARVSITRSVDHNRIHISTSSVDPSDQFPFEITLAELDSRPMLLRFASDRLLDLCEGDISIDRSLSLPKEI